MDTIWTPDLSAYSGPKYQALAEALRAAVRSGALAPGARLPTVRDLAWQLGITPGTVARAYALATQEGLVEAVVGRGTFVLASRVESVPVFAPSPSEPGVVDMRHPQVPDVGQALVLAEALRRLASEVTPAWLNYPSQGDEAPLRAEIVRWLGGQMLGPLGADDLALTHGGQHAVGLVLRCILRGERPVVLVEDLAYPGLRHAARLARATIVAVDTDREGMQPAAFEEACRQHRPQVVCLTPDAQNPTAAVMGFERRTEIVRIARAHDVMILQDDCLSSPVQRLPGLRALAPERCYHVGSLSKTVTPALRFGWAVAPVGLGDALRLTMQQGQFALSRMISDLCLDLLRSGAARDLADAVRTEQSRRLERMVNVLGAYDLSWQPGLPFAWLRLPLGWRPSIFTRVAEARGVLVRPADEFAVIHGRAPNGVRLSVPGQVPLASLDAGLATVARLLASPMADLEV